MDDHTLDALSDMICGNEEKYPEYRSGADLTRFFQRVGFSNFIHDGSTRKWWTLDVLRQLSENNLKAVIYRLADPREYKGDNEKITKALTILNKILKIEGFKIELNGIEPNLIVIKPQFIDQISKNNLKPLPPPDFLNLSLEPGLGVILADRWEQAQKCLNAGAYLASTIIMGSMLEGLFLAVIQKFPHEANTCISAPMDKTGKKNSLLNGLYLI